MNDATLAVRFSRRAPAKKAPRRLSEDPKADNRAEGELVSGKEDEQLSHEHCLGSDAAEAEDEKGPDKKGKAGFPRVDGGTR